MSLENEYLQIKKELEVAKEKLAEAESIVIVEDENNHFTIEERTQAKNRTIKMRKEDIKELEEIFEEIKKELTEFIDNGGEVSQMTLDTLKEEEVESITINFKVVSNNNEKIYCEGYVEINDKEGEDVDWYYLDAQGFPTTQMFIEHEGINGFKGATEEEKWEIEQFRENWGKDAFWIDNTILQSDEDENRTYVRENCTIIINDGAKMECEIKKPANFRGDYVVEVIPKFNGEKVDLVEYMQEMGEIFDPWANNEPTSCIEKGHIYFEMSKDYWEGDEEDHQDRLEDVNEEARRIYAMSLTREMGIYSKYGEVLEQAMDNDYTNEWLFKMTLHKDDLAEELDEFLRKEGLIDELE